MIGVDRTLDLIDLLSVLVRPHVRSECCRQGIEGHAFQAVAVGRIARQGDKLFKRVEGLDYGAQFGPLDRVLSGKTLMPVNMPVTCP